MIDSSLTPQLMSSVASSVHSEPGALRRVCLTAPRLPQVGHRAEGETSRLPRRHLRGVCHRGHQQDSSGGVSGSSLTPTSRSGQYHKLTNWVLPTGSKILSFDLRRLSPPQLRGSSQCARCSLSPAEYVSPWKVWWLL